MYTQIQSPVMVGRDAQLARLESALLASQRGDCRVVVITGEAGVGKSRLAGAIRERATALGCVTIVGECSEAELALPYLPFVEAISNHLAAANGQLETLRTVLGEASAPLARLFPQLGVPDVRFNPTDTPLDKLRLFEAMVTLLRALCSQHGLLVVIEDIHWSDRSTQELLDYLTRRLNAAGAMLVVTHRAVEMDRHHPLLPTVQRWRRAGLSETIALDALSVDEVRTMVAAIFDSDDASSDLARELHDRTEGIPFAVEELLHEAVEHGRVGNLVMSGWRSARLEQLPPPRTLADNIMLRVERLKAEHADILRCAAVLGRNFEFQILVDVSEQAPDVVADALHGCVSDQLVEEDTQRDDAYRFRHVLVRDAVYSDMIVSRRRLLHSRAANVLRASRSEEPAELAHHLIAAGRLEEAGPACAAAGEIAMLRLAPREACDLFARAVAHTHDPRERARLQCRLGEAWHQAGDVAAAQHHLDEGVASLEGNGDHLAAAHHRLSLGRCCWERSEYEQARVHYERARDVLEAAGPSEDLANAYIRLSGLHSFQLDAESAQRLAERAIAIARSAGAEPARIAASDWLGLALCDQGKLDEGLAQLERSAQEAGAGGLYTLEARIVSHALSVLESYGRVVESEPFLERLHSLPGDPWIQVVAPYYEGWVRFWSGRLRDAARSASTCIELAERFGMEGQAAWGRGLLCAVETELGDIHAARSLLPERNRKLERQELLEQGWASLRFLIAVSDMASAETLALELSELPWALAGTALSDTVVEALLAAGRVSEATFLVESLSTHPRAAMHQGHLLRARGRLLIASGHPARAIPQLNEAAAAFTLGGYHLERLRTAVLLAEAQATGGDLDGAQMTLEDTVAGAGACSAQLLCDAAAVTAERLGLAVSLPAVDPAPVAIGVPRGEGAAHDVDAAVQQVGERLVTVLFADVRGYTAMTREHAPAGMAERVATLQRWALLAVERHHGIVDKFAGDSVMATFNAAGWHVDHTRHALEVAVELIVSTAKLDLALGVGIAVGPAIVGRLAEGANITVVGTTTNLASRLQARARGGEILMTADAYARVRDALPPGIGRVERCRLRLKSFDEPVPSVRMSVSGS